MNRVSIAVLGGICAAGLTLGWQVGRSEQKATKPSVESSAAERRAPKVEESRPRMAASISKAEKVESAADLLDWMSAPPEPGSEKEERFHAWRQGLRDAPAAGFMRLRDLATSLIAEGREVEARTVLQWMKEVREDRRTAPFLEAQALEAMRRARDGVDSGVLTAIALTETLEKMGASATDQNRLASKLIGRAANPADAAVIRARLRRGLAAE